MLDMPMRFYGISVVQSPGERFFLPRLNQSDDRVKLSQVVYLQSVKAPSRDVTTRRSLPLRVLSRIKRSQHACQALMPTLKGVNGYTA